MEASRLSENLTPVYQTTRRHIPEVKTRLLFISRHYCKIFLTVIVQGAMRIYKIELLREELHAA